MKGERIVRFLARYWPDYFKPTAYVLQSRYADAVLSPNGAPRVLHEGETISFQLPLPDALEMFEKMAMNSDSTYVFDTIGRKHRVSRAVMKKLKADYKTYINEREAGKRK